MINTCCYTDIYWFDGEYQWLSTSEEWRIKLFIVCKTPHHHLKLSNRRSIPWCVSLRQDCGQLQGHAQRKTQQNWMILRWWRRPRDWWSVPCFTPSPSAPVGRITRTTHRQNGQEPGMNVAVRLSTRKLLDKDGELFLVLTNNLHVVSIQNIIYLNQDKLGTHGKTTNSRQHFEY